MFIREVPDCNLNISSDGCSLADLDKRLYGEERAWGRRCSARPASQTVKEGAGGERLPPLAVPPQDSRAAFAGVWCAPAPEAARGAAGEPPAAAAGPGRRVPLGVAAGPRGCGSCAAATAPLPSAPLPHCGGAATRNAPLTAPEKHLPGAVLPAGGNKWEALQSVCVVRLLGAGSALRYSRKCRNYLFAYHLIGTFWCDISSGDIILNWKSDCFSVWI